jgi:hypothetical protein
MKATACRKVRYWKRVDALIALAKVDGYTKAHRKDGAKAGRRAEARIYQCDICRGRPWHVTSYPG